MAQKNILERIVESKVREVSARKQSRPLDALQPQLEACTPPRDFLNAVENPQSLALIAEVKKASPSQGLIRADFDPVKIATIYQDNGAAAISVLTDEEFFQGKLDFLTDVKSAVRLPVLRKDFIIDPYQVFEARVAGADAVLLIAECLDQARLVELISLIGELDMTALVEFYEPDNLPRVLDAGARLIGINNRNLKTFEVSLEHTIRLRERIPESIPVVAESGIFSHADIQLLQNANVQAVLVGQSLMEADDIGAATRKLLQG